MNGILWLASYPKSGNTWLRAFMHNLLTNAKQPFDINQMSELTHGDSNGKWFRLGDKSTLSELSPSEIAEQRPKAHARIASLSTDSVLVKTHNAMVENAGVPMITPHLSDAAIYIVRNPLDIVISYADHLGVSINKMIEGMSTPNFQSPRSETHVPEIYCDWSTHVKSWTQMSSELLHVIKYEDMQMRPTQTFGNVAKFMGLNPPRDRLKRAIKFSSFKILKAQEKRKGFIERTPVQDMFFRQGTADGWRKTLSDDQVKEVIKAHREQMLRFNYIPDGF
ncbi:MAG: sulfotransferase [Rhodospirillaceae bacterium]|nr:sulfotransferase [Rhodospirillaceae bacterium]|tara:strand:- start:5562 stop:6398 length:837 start_codon:yes stop_codon:yes gene_type:complete